MKKLLVGWILKNANKLVVELPLSLLLSYNEIHI